MRTKSILIGALALVAAGGVTVVAAQHIGSAHASARTQDATPFAMHHACGTSAESTTGHVPEHLAKALELSAEQQTQIDRIGSEACETMARIHADMLKVLTPEQRAKMEDMHRSHASGGIAAFFKKLHGR